MENKIPTAEEVWAKNTDSSINQEEYSAMIEFAKLHVEAALQEASRKARFKYILPSFNHGADYDLDKESILGAYPLNQIK